METSLNKINFESSHFLKLPEGIKDHFEKLVRFRIETNMPKINDPKNNSTVALLIINDRKFWGVNKATAGISTSLKQSVKEALKDDFGKSAHSAVLTHAEVDAMIDACNKNMNAYSAEMYVDRKLCGFCAGQYFTGGSLRRLLPLLNLEILKVYTPDADGYIKEVTLNRNCTFVSNHFD